MFNLRARSLRLTLNGHREATNVARFSPDGRYAKKTFSSCENFFGQAIYSLVFSTSSTICSGSDDATVRLWDAETGEFLGSNNRHALRVVDVAFVPESNKLISMSADMLIRWDSPAVSQQEQQEASSTAGHGLLNRGKSFSMEFDQFTRTRKADFNCMALSKYDLIAVSLLQGLLEIVL